MVSSGERECRDDKRLGGREPEGRCRGEHRRRESRGPARPGRARYSVCDLDPQARCRHAGREHRCSPEPLRECSRTSSWGRPATFDVPLGVDLVPAARSLAYRGQKGPRRCPARERLADRMLDGEMDEYDTYPRPPRSRTAHHERPGRCRSRHSAVRIDDRNAVKVSTNWSLRRGAARGRLRRRDPGDPACRSRRPTPHSAGGARAARRAQPAALVTEIPRPRRSPTRSPRGGRSFCVSLATMAPGVRRSRRRARPEPGRGSRDGAQASPDQARRGTPSR